MAFNPRSPFSVVKYSRTLRYLFKSHRRCQYGTKSSQEAAGKGTGKSHRFLTGSLLVGAVGFVGYAVGKHWTINIETTPNAILCESKSNEQSGNHTRACKKVRREEKLHQERLKRTIDESRDLVLRIKDEVGSPGLVISVSVDGETVWSEGLGYSDVENRVECVPETVMRIASISKPITMAIVAKLMEAGLIDLDKPVNEYVPSWPEKEFKGEKVNVTTRQLVSHLGGVRHYDKNCKKEFSCTATLKKKKEVKDEENKNKKGEDKSNKEKSSEFDLVEYHIKEHYKTVSDALKLFMNDKLCSKPGTDFLYSTHGWALISAVAEKASGHDFPTLLKGLFKDIGMKNSCLDMNDPIIYNRSRYYVKNERGRLTNAPYVDCSYKWAGGGLLSTVHDLNKFGNAMLYSYQYQSAYPDQGDLRSDTAEDMNGDNNPTTASAHGPPGYLKSQTVRTLWTPVDNTKCAWDADGSYAMGWAVTPGMIRHGSCRDQRFYVSHTGGAIGASSVLLILPRKLDRVQAKDAPPPRGVVVSMIVNLQSVGLCKTALEIAKLFEDLD